MKKSSALLLVFVSGPLMNCGVKGKPQPPLTAPVLGRGEPSFSKATENMKIKKKQPIPQDWEDNNEFPEDKGQ